MSNNLREQYSELAEMAGGFIHDLKNHLGTFVLNLQLLAEDFQTPETPRDRRAKKRIDRLQTECQQLVELANEFLRFASVQELHLTPCHLGEVIGEMVDFFTPTAKQSNIDIRSFVSIDLPPVMLDCEMFKQVLLNLMLNAEQAMEKGGEIILQVRCNGDHVELDVIDTGSGMSPAVLAKTFKPFHTTKAGGTGLGLATSKRIIEAHGGTIEVQSEVDHGTKFTIRLPLRTNVEA